MQYQVLARKWRPQNFQEIVGQEHVSRTLLNALESGRIAHAFLFSGPRGSGKTSTARILAKALNCHEGRPGDPCGKCPSCKEVTAGNCMDVLEIDAASNTGVDNVRQLIEQARYQPARDRHKIFIIDEVHMLSNAAFSALLKTLEEPPAHVAFIMATTEYHKIPATILSRCQQYSFKLIPYPLILDRLQKIAKSENIEISDAALEQVVFSSGGSMRDAMSALDQVIAFSGNHVADEDVTTLLGLIEPRVLSQTVKAIAGNDVTAILTRVENLVAAGQDLQLFCRHLLGQFRNLMVLKAGITDTALLGIPETLLPDLREQAALFSKEDLLRLFETLLKTDNSMKYATQTRFQLEMGLIELAHVAKLSSLEDLISEFSSLSEGGETDRYVPGRGTASVPGASSRVSGRESTKSIPERREGNKAEKRSQDNPQNPASSLDTASRASANPESRELLLKIASAVGREALESLLQRLDGARLQGDKLLLEMGTVNGFFRSRIKENLSVIARAATDVIGNRVTVLLDESQSAAPESKTESREPSDRQAENEILNKAKKEPVVQSFLDVFPGQVKAEKIDS
ncbi:MAG: DNA polymerase III subunit gamma/tau [Acidobacteria bacterium]|nr:DNA polymerase III subunit gamma/tau [Acidobacteriota bacterium]